jgi:translation initiation factor 2 alpha subunit (eIF-2alpha)
LYCKGVKENGAYLNLNGYGEREGFVFIGEVAAGWVKKYPSAFERRAKSCC